MIHCINERIQISPTTCLYALIIGTRQGKFPEFKNGRTLPRIHKKKFGTLNVNFCGWKSQVLLQEFCRRPKRRPLAHAGNTLFVRQKMCVSLTPPKNISSQPQPKTKAHCLLTALCQQFLFVWIREFFEGPNSNLCAFIFQTFPHQQPISGSQPPPFLLPNLISRSLANELQIIRWKNGGPIIVSSVFSTIPAHNSFSSDASQFMIIVTLPLIPRFPLLI